MPPTPQSPPQRPRFGFGLSRRWILFALALLASQPVHRQPDHGPASRVARPVQPVLPRTGHDAQRRGDHLQGDGHPGHVQERRDLRGLEADDPLSNGDSRLREHGRALPAAPGERRHGQRRAARNGHAVVADAAVRLRADDPVRRAAVLAVPPGRQRAERPRLVRTLTCPPLRAVGRQGDVRGRRRHRRGEGRAERGRRLPPQPGQVPAARRPHSARRAPVRPARDREDTARARGRGRGERAVLLDGGVRVRRGDRGRRRVARARPVQGGEGERAGDRLHRRARRDRPLAHVRRRRVQRRQRRAGADPQPDPDRDGRVRLGDERDRDRGDQPARRARPGAPPARAVRPSGRGPAARPCRARGNPARAHPRRPARPDVDLAASPRRRRGWSEPTSPTS